MKLSIVINNQLTSLKGDSERIGGDFYCNDNLNKHLDIEYQIRKENPNLSETEIKEKMIEQGYYEYYLSNKVKEVFIF